MISHPLRGPDRRSFITDKSCHNQRIERLWRDIFSSCLGKYYVVFWYLESIDLLDISNETHLFVLHLVFIPRINKSLLAFRQGWDNHPIRTANNYTPNQLWFSGSLTYRPSQPEISVVDEHYGVDWEGPPVPTDHDETNGVECQ